MYLSVISGTCLVVFLLFWGRLSIEQVPLLLLNTSMALKLALLNSLYFFICKICPDPGHSFKMARSHEEFNRSLGPIVS